MSLGKKHIAALVLCFIECITVIAPIFGWTSIVFVLKEDGIFSQLCDDTGSSNDLNISTTFSVTTPTMYLTTAVSEGEVSGCSRQDTILSMIYPVALMGTGLGCIVMGYVFDKVGLRMVRTIAM